MGSGSVVRYEYKDDFDWIRVVDVFPQTHRYLYFEESIQGAINLADHRLPVFEYIGLMASGARALLDSPSKVLLGGLGSCALLHAVARAWPRARTITVESDSRVYELAKQFFRLDPRAKVLIGDIRGRLEASRKLNAFDLALMDCYNAHSIPPRLTSLEFMRILFGKISPGAVMVCNFWDATCNEICGDMLRTILEVFGEIALLDCQDEKNLVVFARKPPHTAWPSMHHFKGKPYPFQVVKLNEPGDWPEYMQESEIMRDENLGEFFDGVGMVI